MLLKAVLLRRESCFKVVWAYDVFSLDKVSTHVSAAAFAQTVGVVGRRGVGHTDCPADVGETDSMSLEQVSHASLEQARGDSYQIAQLLQIQALDSSLQDEVVSGLRRSFYS